MKNNSRQIQFKTIGQQGTDGDGVKLTRVIGDTRVDMLDPFLLLDSFETDEPQDYIGGFPNHPHRGFETVTYMFKGKMRHKDSIGNQGVIEPGGVQWMTTGRGIIHSEMPEQSNGMLHGLQLWVNLPKSDKMTAPAYQEFSVEQVPIEKKEKGCKISVIAGTTDAGTHGVIGPKAIEPIYMDIILEKGAVFSQQLPSQHNAFIFVISGQLEVGESNEPIIERELGILTKGDRVFVKTTSNTRFVFIAGKPLNEPIARHGPFVMNTKQELMQAFDDYNNNRF